MIKLCRDEGFSIIIIVLGVTILIFLAGILIPAFMRIRASATVSEALINLRAICEAQEAYKAEHKTYHLCKESPANGGTDKMPDPWVDEGIPGTNAFADIGFKPENPVRYRYSVESATEMSFIATATGDLDENGKASILIVNKDSWNYPEPTRTGDRW